MSEINFDFITLSSRTVLLFFSFRVGSTAPFPLFPSSRRHGDAQLCSSEERGFCYPQTLSPPQPLLSSALFSDSSSKVELERSHDAVSPTQYWSGPNNKSSCFLSCCSSQSCLMVHRTVLELHSKTELQRSAEQLKQLRLDLKQRNNQRNITSPTARLQETHHNLISDQIHTFIKLKTSLELLS